MLKRIHINQHVLRANLKNNECNPVITIKTNGKNIKANEVNILGPSRVVYSPYKPLQCGARCYVETESEITYK
jgi:hypothetical protein